MSNGRKIASFSSVTFDMSPEEKEKFALKPNPDGYYPVPVGALNVKNSAGQIYVASKSVLSLFSESSDLMRRIQHGSLAGEIGHPKFLPGMTAKQYYHRIHEIRENNIGFLIGKIELIDKGYKQPGCSENVIEIIAHIKPFGEKADYVKSKLEDPNTNCCFSIRSITADTMRSDGVIVKTITKIICWDFVLEPGIRLANKLQSLGFEEYTGLTVDLNNENELASIMDTEETISLDISNENCVSNILDSNKILNKMSSKVSHSVVYKW